MLVLLVGIATLGAASPLSDVQAEQILEQAQDVMPENVTAVKIFLNNMKVALLMTIPILGIIQGGIIIYSTGVVFSAIGNAMGVDGLILLITVALTPFFWLEFLAYSAGITQSVLMATSIVGKKRFRSEIVRTLVILPLMTIILIAGAFIEILFIG